MGVSKAISAFGTLLQRGDGVTPTEGFTTLSELSNIEIPAVETDLIETSHFTSPGAYKEFVLGMKDGGEVTLEGSYVPTDATQRVTTGILADNLSGVKRNFKLVFPDGTAAVKAALNSVMTDPNANIKITAQAAGVGGNAITVAYVVAGVNTPLTIGVAGNAITVNVATNAGSAAISTADAVIAALTASAPALALVAAERGANASGLGIVNAIALTNLAGGAAAVVSTFWTFAAFVRSFVVRAPMDGKLSWRGTLKVTGQPTLA